jgi:beta-lactamase regulating signal transducer with metallopeptidase domain
MRTPEFLKKIYDFYCDGFKSMTVGKTLWLIVLIKLFIMFIVLKIFFFPNYLNTNFSDDKSKANHVREQLLHK